tara:strand:+ start:6847 stop:8556 length:1710 start_codon:yes stop_codon:yes gene_type:complete
MAKKAVKQRANSPSPAVPDPLSDFSLPNLNCTEEIPPPGGEELGAWFDEDAAQIACDFFPTYLRHTEGEWAGKPFNLRPDQRAVVRLLFGWKRADGTRLFRTLWYEIGRKNGKTEFAAGLSLLLLIVDGEFGGQVYSLALDENQAKIVFNKAGVMVGFSPSLMDDLEVFKKSIFCAALLSRFEALSSSPGGKHGFSPSGVIGDEVHEWPDGELYEVVCEGMGARRQPLSILTTTAGIRGKSYAWAQHEYALQVLAGTVVDPTMLVIIFAADDDRAQDDPEYWTTREAWEAANPGLGISPKIEFLEAQCARAKLSNRLENRFKRFYLNLWTEQAVRWLRMSDWDACKGEVSWKELTAELVGRECYVGVDLSTKKDLTCVCFAFPPEADDPDGETILLFRFYVPEATVPNRVQEDKVPYDDWVRQGALIATNGTVIDYKQIESDLLADADRFVIQEVAYDPWNATEFATRMGDEGLEMVEFRQGYASMSEPCKNFEALLMSNRIRHGGHPVARWNAGNIAVVMDDRENIAPAKKKSAERIDGIVAAIMATGRAAVHVDTTSIYAKRGLVVV